jgi:kynurenine formamidase
MSAELIDLSHEVEADMVTYPGLPGPVISDFLGRAESRERYAGQAEFCITRIEMVANTGTYLDAPYHRFADGPDIGQLPLASMAGLPGIVISLGSQQVLEPRHLAGLSLRDHAVLVHTGWSSHWRTARYGDSDHPYVSSDAADALAEAGATLVGIDSVNIDCMSDPRRPAHTALLRRNIPIVEHLTNLQAIANRPFTFFAVPPRIRGMGTFTVRAFAMIEPVHSAK